MNNKSVKIGEIVRKHRYEECISRKKLGDECKIAEATIKNLENGKNVNWSTVMAIASFFNMDLGDLNPCIGKEAPLTEDKEEEN